MIADYVDEHFPGVVCNDDTDRSAEVKVLSMRDLDWCWPDKVDLIWYNKDKIVEIITEPCLRPSGSKREQCRETYFVPEINKYHNS